MTQTTGAVQALQTDAANVTPQNFDAPEESEPALVADLRRSAAVVEGVVTDVNETYDDWFGPRTVFTLGNVKTHVGTQLGGDVTLSVAGGPLPGDKRMSVSHTPRFVLGGRYLIWLVSGSWRFSPAVRWLAIAKAGGQDVLTTDMGYAVRGISDHDGFRIGRLRLLEVDRASPFVEPTATEELKSRGSSLINTGQVLTKDLLVQALRDLAELHGVTMGAFQPIPHQVRPWNQTLSDKTEG